LIDGNIYKLFVDGFEDKVKSRLVPEEPLIIALGDSWYNQAEPIDIVSQLTKSYLTIKAFANTSSGEQALLRDIEPEIQSHPDTPFIVLLSPWGKRLTHGLDDFINESSSKDGIRDIMDEGFWELLEELKAERKARLAALRDWKYENMHFIIHGRDYFQAAAVDGTNKARALLYLVDHINASLKQEIAALGQPNLHYLDLRRTLTAEDWAYDFVPDEQGFKKLAEKFKRFIDNDFQPLAENMEYGGSEYYESQHVEVDVKREQGMKQLLEMPGRESVSQQIKEHIARLKANEGRRENRLHMIFMGNPGTGKTSVARLMGAIYREENILKSGHLVELSAPSLIAKYVGQTAAQVKKQCNEALDGILLIDDAGYFTNRKDNTFVAEALDSLLAFMEDYRERMAVIFLGYPDRMNAFLGINPGIKSRIGAVIDFDDYSSEDLYEIFLLEVSRENFKMSPAFTQAIQQVIGKIYKNKAENFGNAREVKRLCEDIVAHYVERHSAEDLKAAEYILEPDDIPKKYLPVFQDEIINVSFRTNETDILINSLNRHAQIAAYESASDELQSIPVTAFVIMGSEEEAHASLVNRIRQINKERRGLTDVASYTIPLNPEKDWKSLVANLWQAIYNAVGLQGLPDINNTASLLSRFIKSGAIHKILAFHIQIEEWDYSLLDRFFIYVNEVFRPGKRGKDREEERLECFFLLEYEATFQPDELIKMLQEHFPSRNILPKLQPVSIADIEAWIVDHLFQGQYSELGGQMRLEGVIARYFSDGEAWPMEEAQYRLRQVMDNLTPEGNDPEQMPFAANEDYSDESVEEDRGYELAGEDKQGSNLESEFHFSTEEAIRKGEGIDIEFKAGMSRVGKQKIVETICAFLNTRGGTILVGVEDDSRVIGLNDKTTREIDQYKLNLSQMVRDKVGAIFTSYIQFNIEKYNEKILLGINCLPSKQPAILEHKGEQVFLIRSGPSNIKLSNIKEALRYYIDGAHEFVRKDKLDGDLNSESDFATEEIIRKGEGVNIEFKSTIHKGIRREIVETICAFLNTSGGTILIGVEDDSRVIGLNDKTIRDIEQYKQILGYMVRDKVGTLFTSYIQFYNEKYNEKKLLRINCSSSKQPAILEDKGEQFFIIRSGSSNIKTSNIKEVFRYYEPMEEVQYQLIDLQNEIYDLISTNQFDNAIKRLQQVIKRNTDKWTQIEIFEKEYNNIINRRGKYRRAVRNTDELVSNLAEALLVLVEQLGEEDVYWENDNTAEEKAGPATFNMQERVYKLVGEDKLDEAVALMIACITNEEYAKESQLFEGKLRENKRAYNTGIISQDQYFAVKAQVSQNIMALVKEIPAAAIRPEANAKATVAAPDTTFSDFEALTKYILRQLMEDNMEKLLGQIPTLLKRGTESYDDFYILKGRFNRVNNARRMGTITTESASTNINRIREALVYWQEGLKTEDLHPATIQA
jgi:predicted HTH transcriptional regulator